MEKMQESINKDLEELKDKHTGTNTAVGYHFLLQGIFLTQVLNLSLLYLLHCSRIPYPLSSPGKILIYPSTQ